MKKKTTYEYTSLSPGHLVILQVGTGFSVINQQAKRVRADVNGADRSTPTENVLRGDALIAKIPLVTGTLPVQFVC